WGAEPGAIGTTMTSPEAGSSLPRVPSPCPVYQTHPERSGTASWGALRAGVPYSCSAKLGCWLVTDSVCTAEGAQDRRGKSGRSNNARLSPRVMIHLGRLSRTEAKDVGSLRLPAPAKSRLSQTPLGRSGC